MLEITGTRKGAPVSMVWNDGELVGTDWAIREFRDLVDSVAGEKVGYLGLGLPRDDHMQHSESIYWLALAWFDDGVDITGDVPSIPMDPETIY